MWRKVEFSEAKGEIFLQRALPQRLSTLRGPHFVQCVVKPQGSNGVHTRLLTYAPSEDLSSSVPDISIYDISLSGGTESVQVIKPSVTEYAFLRDKWAQMNLEFGKLSRQQRAKPIQSGEWATFNGAIDAIFWQPSDNFRLYKNITDATSMHTKEAYEFVERMLALRLPEEPGGEPQSAQFFDAKRYSSK